MVTNLGRAFQEIPVSLPASCPSSAKSGESLMNGRERRQIGRNSRGESEKQRYIKGGSDRAGMYGTKTEGNLKGKMRG